MALISCSECGKQVSDKATACPNCGAPVSSKEKPEAPTKAQDDTTPEDNFDEDSRRAESGQAKPTTPSRSMQPIILGVAGVAVLGIVYWLMSGGSPSVTATASPESVVRKYFSVGCMDRVPLVAFPDAMRPRMVEAYSGKTSCAVKIKDIDVSGCKDLAVGGGCSPKVTAETGSFWACVVKTADGYKIDWPCTAQYNPTSLAAFKTLPDGTTEVFRATVQLAENQVFGPWVWKHKEDFYGFWIWVGEDRISAYAEKASPVGVQMFDALKDGAAHPLTLEIAADTKGDRFVKRLLLKSWRQRPEETGQP